MYDLTVVSIKKLLKYRIAKYALIGGISTLIHISIASLYIYFIDNSLLHSNITGFSIAFAFSYIVQSKFVFQHAVSLQKAIKYFIVQFSALLLAILSSLLFDSYNSYLRTLIIAVLLPLITYTVHWFWTFKEQKINTKYNPLIALLLGAFIFLVIYDYKILNPTYIEWVMSDDPGQHFLGWHFFRFEPWSFPLGTIKNYHYPSGTSLVYTDSIPLIAIPLKLFSNFLPHIFQYTGLWILATYMLQGLFAFLLLRKTTDNTLLLLLGTTFFILSPIIFIRSAGHEALTAHWLILASLCLYYSPEIKAIKTKWVFLIIAGALVHFYLLVMVLIIWSGYIVGHILEKPKKERVIKIIPYFLLTLLAVLSIMWINGYFVIPIRNASSGGFGIYSMNILSLFNPIGYKDTTFLNSENMPTNTNQWEGYNYLGFGLLLMITVAFLKISKTIKYYNKNRDLPLIIIAFFLYNFSLSSTITFGETVLVSFKYPWILGDLANVLRASGRMFWPVYYIITFTTISIIIKHYDRKQSIFILSFFLIIQIIDFYPYSNRNLSSRTWHSSLISPDWMYIADSIDHIVMMPPVVESDPKYNFSIYAANNNLDINIGYLARENRMMKAVYNKKTNESFLDNKLDERTLYIVDTSMFIKPFNQTKYLFGQLDGYNIIVPKNDKLNLESWFSPNKTIAFNSTAVTFIGWSQPEKKFRWSLDKVSRILFTGIQKQQKMLGLLSINIRTLGEQEIKVSINNNYIGTKKVDSSDIDIEFNFNPEIINRGLDNIIKFEFPNAHRPNNGDRRILAMALKSFRIE